MKYKKTFSKSAKRAFAQKMDEIKSFCDEHAITYSNTMDSFYFYYNGTNYRLSNHTVEASNRGAYDALGNNIREKYHNGRNENTIYYTVGKTRLIEVYNDIIKGFELDGREYRK